MNLNPVGAVIGGVLKAVGGVLKAVYDFLPKVALLVLAGVLAWMLLGAAGRASREHNRAEALAADRDAWKAATGQWVAVAGQWEANFRAAEKLRREETATAGVAQTLASAQCAARVAEARRSAIAINDILHQEIPREPNGCPSRRLIDPDRLRGALQPAPPPAARPR